MSSPKMLHLAVGIMAITWPAGCASIMSGRHSDVVIDSYPSNAQVHIYDKRGDVVATAQTPAVVALKRGDGYFKPARYTASIQKPGYQSAEIPIRAGLNPWVLGNIVFGGIAGLVVDPFTGAAWRLTPSEIRPDLTPLDRPALVHAGIPDARQDGATQATPTEVAPAGHLSTAPAIASNAVPYLNMPPVKSTDYPSTLLVERPSDRF